MSALPATDPVAERRRLLDRQRANIKTATGARLILLTALAKQTERELAQIERDGGVYIAANHGVSR